MRKRLARAALLAACGALVFAAGVSQWAYQSLADGAYEKSVRIASRQEIFSFDSEEWQKARKVPFADRYLVDFNIGTAFLMRTDTRNATTYLYLASNETKVPARQAEALFNLSWVHLDMFLRLEKDATTSGLPIEMRQAVRDYILSLYIGPIVQTLRNALRADPANLDAAFNYELAAREQRAAGEREAERKKQQKTQPQLEPGKETQPPRP